MKVIIDPHAGFCFGVERAIKIAETELQKCKSLFCLGEIVHNDEEIKRLEDAGLQTVQTNQLSSLSNSKILFRAHGEPPSSYENALKNNISVIDATCPIVTKFQKKIRKNWNEIKSINGQIVIYGKRNHPEVIGFTGQTGNKAIVIEGIKDIDKIDFRFPIRLFAQTTESAKNYLEIVTYISKKLERDDKLTRDFKYFKTICGQVSNRIPNLKKFCINNNLIIFVSGKNSSNGLQLFNFCQSVNRNSYFISSEKELKKEWFNHAHTVGITGATSTPAWLMKKIAEEIQNL